MHKLKIFSMILVTLILVACGGGGSDTPAPPANQAPTVNAGADQTVDENATVNLTATASDSDGSISTYAWTQVSGPSISLSATNTATTSFTAPATASSAQVVLRVTVTDDDGSSASDTVTITVNTTNQAPTANAGPDQSVDEASTVTLAGTGTDSDGSIASFSWAQIAGSTVTLSDSNAAGPTFTAPNLSTSTTLSFRLTVTDDRGATATDEVSITVNPIAGLNMPPVANAGADQTVNGKSTVTLDGSASVDNDGSIAIYNWLQISGTTVAIANPNTQMPTFVAPDVAADEILSFRLSVEDNEGARTTDEVSITVTPAPTGGNISGKLTYDNVPHNANDSLNYNGITQDPIRGATVQLLEGSTVLDTTVSDDEGNYSFNAELNKTVRLRVRAELKQTSTQSWDVTIVDNTNSGALYVLDSASFSTGSGAAVTQNLNAGSGWGGSSYTSTRSAAPFHVLDRIYDIIKKLSVVDGTLNLTPLKINWSPNNVAQSGDKSTGRISTSHYTGGEIFLLGAANSDTDEYDGHVIIHEWAHYFEDKHSRSDSIGGSHTGSDRLDMRVAFGEGFGNAWSGIITDDPRYRDSFGNAQSQGFSINVENNSATNAGWYNEASVQSIVYDIYDSNDDGNDRLSLGLKPIYDTLVGKQKDSPAFTSIFSFATYMIEDNAFSASGFPPLLNGQNIRTPVNIWGGGETNDAGNASVLPVYLTLRPGDSGQVCTLTSFGTTNKLANRRYLRLDLATAANYTLTLTATTSSDVDGYISNRGSIIAFDEASGTAPASITANLPAGELAVEVIAYDAAGSTLSARCINAQLTQN